MSANREQIQYWNETAGPKWVRLQETLDAQIRPFGLAAMDRASLSEGERVLDVGCGCGETTLELARRVGPTGRVVGLDVSRTMLARAEQRRREAGLDNVEFVCADAQTHTFSDGTFDLVYSRFGVMFFSDPVAGFGNLRRALDEKGRMCFVCWQSPALNPWMRETMMTVMQFIELEIPRDPHAPGPFALADGERLERILRDAGFGQVDLVAHEDAMRIGGGLELEDAVSLMVDLAVPADKLAALAEDTHRRLREAVRALLERHRTGAGIEMPAAAWLVTARTRPPA